MATTVVLVTNPFNSDPSEDRYLAGALNRFLPTTLRPLGQTESGLQHVDIVLVRNVWPTRITRPALSALYMRLTQDGIPAYNPLHGVDYAGKTYLADYWREGFAVIPTVCAPGDILALPGSNRYVRKPIHGGSGWRVEHLALRDLRSRPRDGCVIQPEIDIIQELSFYFLDASFLHAMVTRNPRDRWDLVPHAATIAELVLAEQLLRRAGSTVGLVRVDLVRTRSDELLLMEIEDWCPFLSLLDTPEYLRSALIAGLVRALDRAVSAAAPRRRAA